MKIFRSNRLQKIVNNQTYLDWLLTTIFISYFLFNLYKYRTDYKQWDFLFFTAVAVFGITFKLSLDIPNKMDLTIKRLLDRGIINSEDHLKIKLEKKASSFAKIWGFLLGIGVFSGWMIGLELKAWNIFLIIFETFLAYLTGRIFGIMVAYGTLGSLLKKENIVLSLKPDHIDGAAGLKPIGDFYFFQAIIASVPAFFIGTWSILLTLWSKNGDLPQSALVWKQKAILLLILAIIFEILVFILPMRSFNTAMCEFKAELLKNADGISKDILIMKEQLLNAKNEQEYNLIKSKISDLNERHQVYEKMPTWPLALKTGKLFAINNFILIIPFIVKHIDDLTKAIQTINQHSPK
ncbi:hypothetical protein [Nostoc sp.]|uniref:hypothetical protein n=1 Tax=Nostoc sp. TaxID=1180 RepID=UPI002FFB84B8